MRNKVLAAAIALFAVPAVADPVVIAALGDSLTQGFGLPQEQGFVPQLQAWLDTNGVEVTLINAGVSGDTTAGGLSRIAWTLTPEVDAVIIALGGNDLLRGIDPATSRANLTGIMQAAKEAEVEVLLVGMSAPGNFGPEYKTSFDAIYPELAEAYDAQLMKNFFAGLGEFSDPAALRAFLQADGVHPNAEGVARIVEGIGPEVLQLIARIR